MKNWNDLKNAVERNTHDGKHNVDAIHVGQVLAGLVRTIKANPVAAIRILLDRIK